MATIYRKRGKRMLGKLVGRILALHANTEDDFSRHFAPSELWPRMRESLWAQTHEIIREAGYNPVTFVDEVAAITTPNWAYMQGLDHCVPRHTCLDCGPQLIVGESTTRGHDPYTLITLACGHTVL